MKRKFQWISPQNCFNYQFYVHYFKVCYNEHFSIIYDSVFESQKMCLLGQVNLFLDKNCAEKMFHLYYFPSLKCLWELWFLANEENSNWLWTHRENFECETIVRKNMDENEHKRPSPSLQLSQTSPSLQLSQTLYFYDKHYIWASL